MTALRLAGLVIVVSSLGACGTETPLQTQDMPPRPSFLYDYQSLCIFDARLSCHGNPIFPWDNDYYGGGTVESYLQACPDDPPNLTCLVRSMTVFELGRLTRVLDSLSTLDPSCHYARTWLQGRLSMGKIKAYDAWNDEEGDVHWDFPNDPYARLHIYHSTFGFETREFMRYLMHEAAHGSLGKVWDFGPDSAEEEALRCVPEP